MKSSLIKPHYQGFAPQHISFPQTKCAFYHCAVGRWEGRRYCKQHSLQYDKEALAGESKVISGDFAGSNVA